MSSVQRLLKHPGFYEKILKMFFAYLKYYGYEKHNVRTFLDKCSNTTDKIFMRRFRQNFKIKMSKTENARKKTLKNYRSTIKYFKNAKTILDYGGSNGYMAAELGKILKIPKKNNYVVDIPEWAGKKIVPHPDITFLPLGQNNEACIKSKSIDVITSWHVLHHVKDLPKAIKFIKRVLKPKGVFIIKEHDIKSQDEFRFVDLEHMMFAVGFRGLSMKDYSNVFFKGRSKKDLSKLINMKKIFSSPIPFSRDYSYYAVYKS